MVFSKSGEDFMAYDFKWIRHNMSLYYIDKNCQFTITLLNSGDLATDFNKYTIGFLIQRSM